MRAMQGEAAQVKLRNEVVPGSLRHDFPQRTKSITLSGGEQMILQEGGLKDFAGATGASGTKLP